MRVEHECDELSLQRPAGACTCDKNCQLASKKVTLAIENPRGIEQWRHTVDQMTIHTLGARIEQQLRRVKPVSL